MRRACALVVALAMVVSGCGGIRVVDPDRPGEILLDLNAAAEGKPVRVELLSGQTLSGTGIHAASDSTTWFDAGDRRVAVSTAGIAKVDVVSRRRGGRPGRGALIGGVLGGLPAAGAAFSGGDTAPVAAVFLVVGAVGGALLGAGLGLMFAGEDETSTTYIINAQSAGLYLD